MERVSPPPSAGTPAGRSTARVSRAAPWPQPVRETAYTVPTRPASESRPKATTEARANGAPAPGDTGMSGGAQSPPRQSQLVGQEETQTPPEQTEHWSQTGQGTMQAPELHTSGAVQRDTQVPSEHAEQESQTGHGGGEGGEGGAGPMGGGRLAMAARTAPRLPW